MMISAAEARQAIKIDSNLLLKSIEQSIEYAVNIAVAKLHTTATVCLDKPLATIGQEQIINSMQALGYKIKYNSGNHYNESYQYFTISW